MFTSSFPHSGLHLALLILFTQCICIISLDSLNMFVYDAKGACRVLSCTCMFASSIPTITFVHPCDDLFDPLQLQPLRALLDSEEELNL